MTRSRTVLNRSSALVPLWCAWVLLAGGCSLKQAAPMKESFLVEVKRTQPPRSPPGKAVLRVRNVRVVPPFDGRGFVYRHSEWNYASDFYHEFLISPHALFTEQVRQWLGDSGLFGPVLDPGGRLDAAYSLEGRVGALYGDLRDKKEPKAVLAMQFVLLNEQAPGSSVLFHRSYHQEVALQETTPAALASGWSQALEQILRGLEQDLSDWREKDRAQGGGGF